MIIAGPNIPKGKSTDAFACVWDILPTVMEITAATYPADKVQPRGRSMLPLFAGAAEIHGPQELVDGEMLGGKWMRQDASKAVAVRLLVATGIGACSMSKPIPAK